MSMPMRYPNEVRCKDCQFWHRTAQSTQDALPRCNNQQSPNAEQHTLAQFWCGCGRLKPAR